ncbi:MAG TPA: hypothetical protein VJM33_16545, partial [Microthrixaceae bacterium]|nr:hypothetical protein [Microthrixaceae bacterium]
VPAPGLPRGHVLLGYDEEGRCPMLVDGRCSIYAHRPRTCRTYDCRIFPAAGVEPDPDQPAIAAQVARWRFDHPSDGDRAEHRAVRTAATVIAAHPEIVDAEHAPASATRLAVQAVALHDLFAGIDAEHAQLELESVAVEISRRRGRSRQSE